VNALKFLIWIHLTLEEGEMTLFRCLELLKKDNINPTDFFEFNKDSVTRGHSFKLKKPRTLHKLRQNAFGVRVINDWNNLHEETVSCSTVESFKKRLSIEWKNHPERFFE